MADAGNKLVADVSCVLLEGAVPGWAGTAGEYGAETAGQSAGGILLGLNGRV
jgi:hypothetical protein